MVDTSMTVDGVATRFIAAGRGQPVILLHGIGMSADCFHRNIGDLASFREVFALDLIGHGFTGYAGLGGQTPLVALSRHVLRFMDVMGLSSADFVGSSLGAGVALYCYLHRPSAVRRCIAAGSSTPFIDGATLGGVLSKARANAAKAMELGTREALEQRLRNLLHDPGSVSEELLSAQMEICRVPYRTRAYDEIVESVLRTGGDPAATPAARLEEVRIPVLAIVGKEDPRSPLELIEPGLRRLPDAQLLVYERCGHFPFLEYPERFARDAEAFLTG